MASVDPLQKSRFSGTSTGTVRLRIKCFSPDPPFWLHRPIRVKALKTAETSAGDQRQKEIDRLFESPDVAGSYAVGIAVDRAEPAALIGGRAASVVCGVDRRAAY